MSFYPVQMKRANYQSNHFWNWNVKRMIFLPHDTTLSIEPFLELKLFNFVEVFNNVSTINRTIFGIETTKSSAICKRKIHLSIEPFLELKRYSAMGASIKPVPINRTIFGIETCYTFFTKIGMPSINRTIFGIETEDLGLTCTISKCYQSNHFWNWNGRKIDLRLPVCRDYQSNHFWNWNFKMHICINIRVTPYQSNHFWNWNEIECSGPKPFCVAINRTIFGIETISGYGPGWCPGGLSIEPFLELKRRRIWCDRREWGLSIEPFLELKRTRTNVSEPGTRLSIEPFLELKRLKRTIWITNN